MFPEQTEEPSCPTCKYFIDTTKDLPDFSSKIPDCSLGGFAVEACEKYEANSKLLEAIGNGSWYYTIDIGARNNDGHRAS